MAGPIKLDELVDLVNIASEGVEVQTISIDDEHCPIQTAYQFAAGYCCRDR